LVCDIAPSIDSADLLALDQHQSSNQFLNLIPLAWAPLEDLHGIYGSPRIFFDLKEAGVA
jgi:hypothetical protein